ncbi:MAG: proline--tRNA ligase [Nitrospirae bacterium]|nr:proline--tRNA ligase [Nitrospirota bacterium]
MRFSRTFIPTLRETPAEAEAISHILMLRGGYVRQLASGLYIYLPLGWKVLNRINKIIKEEMDAIGAQEISMPVLHPAELWQETGRWFEIKEEMFRLKDRGNRDMCLGMTHEEIITWLASKEFRSYRDLPQVWYQLQTKMRDEARPKSGVLRTREFLMKDSYSFDRDDAGLEENYKKHTEAYHRLLQRCGLKFYQVESDPGMMGGRGAHEFMATSPAGEDRIVLCAQCGYAANTEFEKGIECPKCNTTLRVERAIEIGNIFKLGTKYSVPLKAFYLDESGKEKPIVMGSYGLGPARIAAAAIEQSHDKDGIIWARSIAPFDVEIIPLNIEDRDVLNLADTLYKDLKAAGIEVLIDDRDERPGIKFKDADLIGIPWQVIVGGRSLKEGFVEIKSRKTKQIERLHISDIKTGIFRILVEKDIFNH